VVLLGGIKRLPTVKLAADAVRWVVGTNPNVAPMTKIPCHPDFLPITTPTF
jgi:hypothetical protein